METILIANIFGFLALCSYNATLLPSILRIIAFQTRKTNFVKVLLKHRRQIGLLAFAFGLAHGFILARKRNIDFLELQTYWTYIQGITIFIIFTVLAITSNNWSVRKLRKHWKKLHSLTYLVMFLVIWHICDKMYAHWSFLTPLCLFQSIYIMSLFFWRKRNEYLSGYTQKNRPVEKY